MTKGHIAKITLDERTILRRNAEIEHERNVAINDILAGNEFEPKDVPAQPLHLYLAVSENRLHLTASSYDTKGGVGEEIIHIKLPMKPFRKIIRDYFLICESYFEAMKAGQVGKIEAIDMGRRGIHNEGSEMLSEVLSEKVTLDFETARRLFTLICVLHIK